MTVRILQGDVRAVLATLPADSFDCVVTSPPYWGLRDYGVEGQIGLEPTLDGYIDTMADVFAGIWRALKPRGTFWLNIGDCYATGAGKVGDHPGEGAQGERWKKIGPARPQVPDGKNPKAGIPTFQPNRMPQRGLKPKDLCLIPARLALRLQADGWWVRSEIIWHKPNPMPESVTDRPTSAHEKIWLLTKSERYFYDAEAIAEVANSPGGRVATPYTQQAVGSTSTTAYNENKRDTKNARNVWTIASHPFAEAHFATFPPELVERCIKAGCPPGGNVLEPFGGAGTTGLVADRLGRDATLIELNPAYIEIARRRIEGDAPLFAEVSA